jgi:drug/metabolite transporter (DMT)-like permease
VSLPIAHEPPGLRVHAVLVGAQLCGASLPVLGRVALLGQIPANAIVLIRLLGGLLVFLALARAGGAIPVRRSDWPRLVASALLGMALNMSLFVNGLAWTTATNASVLGTTVPVFTAVTALWLGAERFRGLRVLGIAVALWSSCPRSAPIC